MDGDLGGQQGTVPSNVSVGTAHAYVPANSSWVRGCDHCYCISGNASTCCNGDMTEKSSPVILAAEIKIWSKKVILILQTQDQIFAHG